MIVFQNLLLEWYDHHQRSLPWRARPGDLPNPYHVWLSEIMLQQTTVATVQDYFRAFIERWPTLANLAQADLSEIYHAWQGLGYYSRAKNLHRCAQHILAHHDGRIPRAPEQLLKLPGIGAYTSAAIAAIAFNHLILPVDGNITRVISRLEAIETPLPSLKNEIQRWADAHPPLTRPGDFAQAIMDLGSEICRPKNPACDRCPLQGICQAYHQNKQHQIPFKTQKKDKPIRYGQVFVCFNKAGDVQIRQRPATGLLANLYEFPSDPWKEVTLESLPRILTPMIKHTFTHFHLFLHVISKKTEDLLHEQCFWVKPEELQHYALPTVMHKVWKEVA